MPCDRQNLESLDNYRNKLAQLEAIIKEQNCNHIVLSGDFNADPYKGRFWNDLIIFMKTFSLVVIDKQLPKDSFTYLCPAKSSTSWLDHVLCTEEIANIMDNIRIDYGKALYDHFPIYFELCMEMELQEREVEIINVKEHVKWDKLSDHDKRNIKSKMDCLLAKNELIEHDIFQCETVGCKSKLHRKSLDKLFKKVKAVLL